MYKPGNIKVSVGGPESDLGTAVERTQRLPVTGYVEVNKQANKAPSEVITGRSTIHKNYIDSIDLSMEVPMELHCDKGTGLLLVSNIGQDLATPVQVGGAVRISYTGTSASCKIVVANIVEPAAKTIAALKGALGAEEADTGFATTGTIDLTGADYDTLTELKTKIASYADYDCEILFGADACPTTDPLAITAAQAAGNSVVVYFKSADSGVYLHRFTPVLTGTERPTLSFQVDGTGLSYDVLAGAVVDALSLSADLKGRVALTASMIGTATTTSETATTVALNEKKPMKFSGSKFYLAGTGATFVRSLSATIANNHSTDEGFGAGSLYKQDHSKGMFNVNGTITMRSTTATEVEYAKRITEDQSSLTFLFTGDNLATSIPEMLLVRIPHVELNATKSAGDTSIDTEFSFDMVDPQSYDEPLTVDMLTTDAVKYN